MPSQQSTSLGRSSVVFAQTDRTKCGGKYPVESRRDGPYYYRTVDYCRSKPKGSVRSARWAPANSRYWIKIISAPWTATYFCFATPTVLYSIQRFDSAPKVDSGRSRQHDEG